MNKLPKVILVPMLVLGIGIAVHAQAPGGDGAIEIKLSELDLDYVYRDAVIREISGVDNTALFSGLITLTGSLHVGDKVDVLVELENKRFDAGAYITPGLDAIQLFVERAYIHFKELYFPELAGCVGIQDVKLDWRGKGHPFFVDARRSESIVDPRWIGGARDESEPVAVTLCYHPKDTPLCFCLIGAMLRELGDPRMDESVLALAASYKLEAVGKDSSLYGLLAFSRGEPANIDLKVWTLGLGAALIDPFAGAPGLEFFGEFYRQWGGYEAAGVDFDTKGMGFYLGARYTAKETTGIPWIELSYTLRTGDEDATDTDDNTFYSYENVREAAILEDHYYGLDIDTNYQAWKIMGGCKVDVGTTPRKLRFDALLGFFRIDETDQDDDLGTEFDIGATLEYTANLAFDAKLAFLFGASGIEPFNPVENEDSARLFTAGATVRF